MFLNTSNGILEMLVFVKNEKKRRSLRKIPGVKNKQHTQLTYDTASAGFEQEQQSINVLLQRYQ